jgi:hypothetical protein
MKNPFKIQKETYLHTENTNKVSTFVRFIVFVLDFSLVYLFFFLLDYFFGVFADTTENEGILLIFFCSIIFASIEYYFDGSIFKIIFGIRSININGNKLNYFAYFFKFYIRFVAVFIALIRIWTMLIPLVFIINLFINFKYYEIISDFLGGKMKGLWYDDFINQNVIYIKKKKHEYSKDLPELTSLQTNHDDKSNTILEERKIEKTKFSLYSFYFGDNSNSSEKQTEKIQFSEKLHKFTKTSKFNNIRIFEKLTSDEVIIISIIVGSIFCLVFGNLFGETQYFLENGERTTSQYSDYSKIDFNYIIAVISFIVTAGISYIFLNRKINKTN